MDSAKAIKAPKRAIQALHRPLPGETLIGLPFDLELLMSDRPLIVGEDVEIYDGLLGTILGSIKPTDAVEAILVKDIVDLLWEARRLKRWKDQILASARREALERVLRRLVNGMEKSGLVEDWADASQLARNYVDRGNEEAMQDVRDILETAGMSTDVILAQALLDKLPEIEAIERLISKADQRRDSQLRELERRREGLAWRVRTVSQDIIDVEVDPPNRGKAG